MAITYFRTKAEAEAVPGAQVSWCIVKDGKPWAAATDEDIIQDSRPTVSKWQLVQALVDAGFTEAQIDTAVATLTVKRQRFWKYTNIIDRDNPFASGLRSALPGPPSPGVWNGIFLAAAALDPLKV
mgnify:CR=1 FL=1